MYNYSSVPDNQPKQIFTRFPVNSWTASSGFPLCFAVRSPQGFLLFCVQLPLVCFPSIYCLPPPHIPPLLLHIMEHDCLLKKLFTPSADSWVARWAAPVNRGDGAEHLWWKYRLCIDTGHCPWIWPLKVGWRKSGLLQSATWTILCVWTELRENEEKQICFQF